MLHGHPRSHVFQPFFFNFFLSKGSCKFCYSWSNRLCMVIQSHMYFKLFFSKFFCQRGLASFVTPRVTEVAWSSQITCFFKLFFFTKFFCQRGLAGFVTPGVTEVAWSSKVTCFSNLDRKSVV